MAAMRLLGPLVIGTCCLALVHCSESEPSDCAAICAELDQCHYLPSILGAPFESVDAKSDCTSRCQYSTQSGPYEGIANCWRKYSSVTECENFGQCLREHFRGSPITGASNVSVQTADASFAEVVDAGCASTASTGGVARTFIESWGERSFGDTRACSESHLIDYFDNVPADLDASVGVQVGTDFTSASCREFRHNLSIAAGQLEQDTTVALTDGGPCSDPPASDAGSGDASTPQSKGTP